MATTKNITMKQFNGTDYDTLYPKTKVEQVEGAYTQQQILSNATAALFGLGDTAVPDEVLAFLGKYAQHWWKRRTLNAVLGEASRINGFLYTGNTVTGYAYYSDSYVINSDGAIELVNPTKITVGYSTYANFNSLKGKYFYTTSVYLPLTGKFWYMPSDAPDASRGSDSDTGEYYVKVTVSELSLVKGDFEYISESSDDVYPRLGYLNGYEYQYMGIPFDNAVNGTKIETGSYIGTGTYGSSNPCSLTFGVSPSILIISGVLKSKSTSISGIGSVIMNISYGHYGESYAGYSISGIVEKTENQVYWYSDNAASEQMNTLDSNYYYIALG